nr:DNA adenine methylase [Gemmatimonadaceae bacterium]
MSSPSAAPLALAPELPERVRLLPQLRYMGSKYRLLPWLHDVLSGIEFHSVLDPFAGAGAVSFLLKCMGKTVVSSDALHIGRVIAHATVENSTERLADADVAMLLNGATARRRFIEDTFSGIFFTPADLQFLDRVWGNLPRLGSDAARSLALTALIRAAIKRQPRGVFTVAGDPERYKDGRRDLQLSLEEHFVEGVALYNAVVFSSGAIHRAMRADVFSLTDQRPDLVYLDPPYVPRADDNCYVKRYHFLEGLATYWEGARIMASSRVKKLEKPFSPFSYRRTAIDAFTRLFKQFDASILALSYSSNAFPDLDVLVELMGRTHRDVVVHER